MDSQIVVTRSSGDFVFDSTSRQFLDLCMGYGSVSFGHNHPAIVRRIKEQLDCSYSPGFLDVPVRNGAIQALNSLLPNTHHTQAIFSTGMECVEASLRLAAHITNRTKFVAFQGSMHGKSLLTATLAGKDCAFSESTLTSLPYIDKQSEDDILRTVENILHHEEHAALLLEPIQMSSNGRVPDIGFLDALYQICHRYNTLLIFDEILSGFYRTGSAFFFQSLAVMPDIVLTGKALGSGLPAAALISDKTIDRSALNYRIESTYTNHPLTCAAVSASIEISKEADLRSSVGAIERIIVGTLDENKLFGKGAMWCYKIDAHHDTLTFFKRLVNANIIVSFFEGYIRLLPSYFIDLSVLESACKTIHTLDGCR